MLKHLKAKVSEELDGERFDIALVALFKTLSRKKIKEIIDVGGAYINSKRTALAKKPVFLGQTLEIYFADKSDSEKTIKILNEEKDFLVIDKPPFIPSQGTLDSDKGTVTDILKKHNPKENLFLVHRLDKETSGLMILAKNKPYQEKFETLFKERKIEKKYLAICFFKPPSKEGTIKQKLAADRSRKNAYFVSPTGREAESHYKVIHYNAKFDISLLLITPKTGRTHQIRVHLAHIGCPIVGDKTYAQNILGHPLQKNASRQFLHASEVSFVLDDQSYSFLCPMEKEMADFMASYLS